MAETTQGLPLYELAQGAAYPKGRQLTIRWWSHLNRNAMLIDLTGSIYHLRRRQIEERHFNVIGELREAERFGLPEAIVRDDGVPEEDQWPSEPVYAEIVVHLATKTFHMRYRDEWEVLLKDSLKREMEGERNKILRGVPAPVVSFCLGADSLMDIETLEKVLGKNRDNLQAKLILQGKLMSTFGIHSSLVGHSAWSSPGGDWNPQDNIPGFAYASIDRPNAIPRRVVIVGLMMQSHDKMQYIGVTALGALSNEAVKLYNKGTAKSLQTIWAARERSAYLREYLQRKWPGFFKPRPVAPIVFHPDPDQAKPYILALTQLAIQRATDPTTLDGQKHHKGCVCEWITQEKEQLVCGWCSWFAKGATGPQQFCDHINGHRHQGRCGYESTLAPILRNIQELRGELHCPECHRTEDNSPRRDGIERVEPSGADDRKSIERVECSQPEGVSSEWSRRVWSEWSGWAWDRNGEWSAGDWWRSDGDWRSGWYGW